MSLLRALAGACVLAMAGAAQSLVKDINATFAAELRDARAGAPMLWLMGLARRDLPFGDGRTVHVALPAPMSSSTTDALGRASLALPIPASPAFTGVDLFIQCAIADPTSSKGGGLALSDALQVLIGR